MKAMKAMKAMKRTHLFAVLIGMIAMGIFAADASAMYHPGMGRFMQRDPGAGGQHRIGASGSAATTGRFIPRDPTGSNQYADGMNLYQYVRSNPIALTDPYGLQASQPAAPDWSLANVAKGIVATTKKAGHPRPVECIFSYSKRTVCCSDGQHSYCCEAVSGRDEHMNNPDSQGVEDKGPVPVGEYWAKKSYIHKRHNIYWHELQKKVGGTYQPYGAEVEPGGRSHFGFHPGTVSWGCVTVLNNATNKVMPKPYGNECFKNMSFLIGQSKYCDKKWDGGARLFVGR